MSAHTVIVSTNAMALSAAEKIEAAAAELRRAAAMLRATEGYKRRGGKITMEWYRHDCIHSVYADTDLEACARFLRSDVRRMQAGLAEAQAEDERERSRRAAVAA